MPVLGLHCAGDAAKSGAIDEVPEQRAQGRTKDLDAPHRRYDDLGDEPYEPSPEHTLQYMSSHRTQDAVNVYGLGEIFQVFAAESLHLIAIAQAADGLWTDQELTGLGRGCQTRRQVRHRAARCEGPAGPVRSLEAGRPHQGEP